MSSETMLFWVLGITGAIVLFTRQRRKRTRSSGLKGIFIMSALIGVMVSGFGGGAAGLLTAVAPHVHSGTLNCTQLEQLWRAGGGSSSTAFMAAEIAKAESGGEQYATDHNSNGSVDYGYWQIDTVNGGSPASYDPLTNARQAVSLYKADGWYPWVTWRHGAEIGLC